MPNWGLGPVLLSVIKVSSATIFMGVCLYLINMKLFAQVSNLNNLNLIIHIMVMVTSGIIIFLAGAWIFKCQEIGVLTRLLRRKRG
jgi:hypothetical protein